MAIVELFTLILEAMLILISPEKTAEKVKDINTNRTTKVMLSIVFTLIYLAIMFLIYCIFIFYYRIFRD